MPSNQWMPANNSKIQLLFSILVAELPVIATYASGIPGLSAADLLLVILWTVVLLGYRHRRTNRFAVRPTLILAALYLMVLFSMISLVTQRQPQYVSVAIRMIRYFFYLSVVGFCSTRILNIELCKSAIRLTGILATVYMFVQYAVYTQTKVVLRGFLPFLKLYTEGYASRDYQTLYATDLYRPTAFFLEPAHYARYAILALILFLFRDGPVTGKQISVGIFLSLGVLISTSSQGYMLLALVWPLFLLTRRKFMPDAATKNLCLLAILALPVIVICLFQLPFVQSTLARSLNIDLSNNMTAVGARLGGFKYYLELQPLYKLIGMGFGAVPAHGWMSSAVYWLYGSGLLVFALYCAYAMKCIFRLTGAARIIALVFFLLFFTDDCFYSYMCVLFLSVSLLKPIQADGQGDPVS